MCGLCGIYASDMGSNHLSAFRLLQLVTQTRGMHSTGLAAYYPEKDKVELYRAVGGLEALATSPDTSFSFDGGWKFIPDSKPRASEKAPLFYDYPELLLGHGRHATIGVIDVDSAHPFEFEDVVGMHNGTMHEYWYTKLDTYDKDMPDSYAVIKKLDQLADDEEATKEFLTTLRGEYCFVWFNRITQTLHFYRNSARSLFMTALSDNKGMAFASEEWMLNAVSNKFNLNLKVVPLGVHQYVVLAIDEIGKITVEVDEEVTPNFTTPPMNVGGYGNYYERYGGNYYDYRSEEVESLYKRVPDTNIWLSRAKFEGVASDGCCICAKDLAWDKFDDIRWHDADTPLCIECHEALEDDSKGVA